MSTFSLQKLRPGQRFLDIRLPVDKNIVLHHAQKVSVFQRQNFSVEELVRNKMSRQEIITEHTEVVAVDDETNTATIITTFVRDHSDTRGGGFTDRTPSSKTSDGRAAMLHNDGRWKVFDGVSTQGTFSWFRPLD